MNTNTSTTQETEETPFLAEEVRDMLASMSNSTLFKWMNNIGAPAEVQILLSAVETLSGEPYQKARRIDAQASIAWEALRKATAKNKTLRTLLDKFDNLEAAACDAHDRADFLAGLVMERDLPDKIIKAESAGPKASNG